MLTALAAINLQIRRDSYQIGAGVGFGFGDWASISAGAAMGQIVTGQDFWGASILASFDLSDSVNAQIAYGYKHYNNALILWCHGEFGANCGNRRRICYEPGCARRDLTTSPLSS